MAAHAGPSGDGSDSPGGVQRLDKWLWYARFFKTRSLAAKMITNGKVRLTVGEGRAERVGKASQTVRVGDVLTFPQGTWIRVVKVILPGTRRGPASEAATLYEDLSGPDPKASGAKTQGRAARAQGDATTGDVGGGNAGAGDAGALGAGGQRDAGAGRPTKRDRRALEALKRGDLP